MSVVVSNSALAEKDIRKVDTTFICDCREPAVAAPHFWEHTVGSCHAPMALRADWQAQMRRAHDELGFRYVRFHGILSDDMGTFLIENNQPLYSFFNTDQIIDFLLSIGMKPFVELSFMPTGLSSGDAIVFHYRANVTPPRDYEKWSTLIQKLISHWVDRYGVEEVRQWFFEVWNEPNLTAFWTATQDDYFKLYQYTVQAVKSIDEKLQVGGPATADNAWINEFKAFCDKTHTPVDFISTHHYPTDAFGKPGDDTETQLADSRRSVLREEARQSKAQAGNLPLYYTEWSSSSNPRDRLHDEPYAASFIVKTVMEAAGLVEAYSYWTFSDIFEENYFPSIPFHGGFGLLNIHGVAKPSYRAFELMHALGSEKLPVTGAHETVDSWVFRDDKKITVLFTNFALPRHSIHTVTAHMILKNAGTFSTAVLHRIDDNHANAPALWREMGAPEDLKADVLRKLHLASELIPEMQAFECHDDELSFDIVLPALSIAAVTFSTESVQTEIADGR